VLDPEMPLSLPLLVTFVVTVPSPLSTRLV
jgi:hypothetical protein